jgi:hypothetical protein
LLARIKQNIVFVPKTTHKRKNKNKKGDKLPFGSVNTGKLMVGCSASCNSMKNYHFNGVNSWGERMSGRFFPIFCFLAASSFPDPQYRYLVLKGAILNFSFN